MQFFTTFGFWIGEMRNGRPKAAFLIQLLFALYVLICPGAPTNNTHKPYILKNLTVGYLTAAKGILGNRQGLAISGALTFALKQVSGILVYGCIFLLTLHPLYVHLTCIFFLFYLFTLRAVMFKSWYIFSKTIRK